MKNNFNMFNRIVPFCISICIIFSFTSCKKDVIPTLTTVTVSNVTENSATFSASISDDGGTEIIMRGFVWDTVTNPSLESKLGFSENGTGSGDFTFDVENLTFETTFYVRSYATNEVGTAYGNETTFSTDALTWNGTPCTDCETVTDIDGNTYLTTQIGDQCWLAENLKTTKYNDGTDITNITVNTEWNNLFTGAYSWYDNNISNKDIYGAIYNYYAVETGKLCPEGWHVATDSEWKVLEGTIDSEYSVGNSIWNNQSWRGSDSGKKLKTRLNWYNNGNGTDAYGFQAVPNGFRNAVTGSFEHSTEWGTIWTDKDGEETEVFRREFSDHDDNIARYNSNPRSGYAVRCIKN